MHARGSSLGERDSGSLLHRDVDGGARLADLGERGVDHVALEAADERLGK